MICCVHLTIMLEENTIKNDTTHYIHGGQKKLYLLPRFRLKLNNYYIPFTDG